MSNLKVNVPALVARERCATCIFGSNSPVGKRRFRQLAEGWRSMQGHQTCHLYGTSEGGTDVWCAGFWQTQVAKELRDDFERNGLIRYVEEGNVEPC